MLKIRESNEAETLQSCLTDMSPISLEEPNPKNNFGEQPSFDIR